VPQTPRSSAPPSLPCGPAPPRRAHGTVAAVLQQPRHAITNLAHLATSATAVRSVCAPLQLFPPAGSPPFAAPEQVATSAACAATGPLQPAGSASASLAALSFGVPLPPSRSVSPYCMVAWSRLCTPYRRLAPLPASRPHCFARGGCGRRRPSPSLCGPG
jgi:hypothetical protein